MSLTTGILTSTLLIQANLKLSQIDLEGSSETGNNRAPSITHGELRFLTLTFFKGLKKHQPIIKILSFLYRMKLRPLGYKRIVSEF